MEYDVFISHASEDKADVARPLAMHLQARGLKVWLDELELTLGDSLRRNIDHGLSQSMYGVVILSHAFFSKEWPNKELDGLVAREDGSDKVILPVWHNVGAGEIVKYSPMLAGKLAVSTSRGLDHVAEQIFNAVRRGMDGDETPKVKLAPSESEILERFRRRILVADSSWEIRKTLYELEEYLAKYPHSPEARLLKDRTQAAMRRAETMETLRKVAPVLWVRSLWLVLASVVIGMLLYLNLNLPIIFLAMLLAWATYLMAHKAK